jgi:hypothetical protein
VEPVPGARPAAPTHVDSETQARERAALIALLKLAYSGELAAAHAYEGHWKSVRSAEERVRLKSIESEEWQHRAWVGEMLADLGEAPDPDREIRMAKVGRLIGFLCHVGGWLLPMYGAGRLESRNVMEYVNAARHASRCGCDRFIPGLLHMAEVEWEHEYYFRAKVRSHPLGRKLPLWDVPPLKEDIRRSLPS